MPSIFITGNTDISLKYGSLYITPKVTRQEVRESVRIMQQRAKELRKKVVSDREFENSMESSKLSEPIANKVLSSNNRTGKIPEIHSDGSTKIQAHSDSPVQNTPAHETSSKLQILRTFSSLIEDFKPSEIELRTHKVSIKYLNHMFISTKETKITGPALAFLARSGIPVTYIIDGRISHEFIPITSHGSPKARIQQMLDPPRLVTWKKRSYVKNRIRQLKILDRNLDYHPLISIAKSLSLKTIRLLTERIRDCIISGQKDITFNQQTIKRLLGSDPPTFPPEIREGLSILSSTINYQILLSGLLPLAPGYLTSLKSDLRSELENAVIYRTYLSDRENFRKRVLNIIDDTEIGLRGRILKGSMKYAKFCRDGEQVNKPALISLPRRLME